DGAAVLADQLDASDRVRAAADQERGPRVRHVEWHAGERPLRLVALQLKAADPVTALMLALVVVAAREDGVAANRLAEEGIALGDPIRERASLEIEIQRLAVGAQGENAFRRRGGDFGLGEK